MEVRAEMMMEHAFAGDRADDFHGLFQAYYACTVRQVYRIIPEQQTAEDIAQDVFLQFYHTDRSLIQNIPAWLAKASIYAAYNHIRSEQRRQLRQEKEAAQHTQVMQSAEDAWLEKAEIEHVREVLQELDERERTLLLMKYSGFRYADLAQATGIDERFVGTMLSRAKKHFHKLYQRMRGNRNEMP